MVKLNLLGGCVVLARAGQVLSNEIQIHELDCDLCKCIDRFWQNCTDSCVATRYGTQNESKLVQLEAILNKIGSGCQVYAEMTLPSRLAQDDWCSSTSPGRPGFKVAAPPTSLDGYNVVRAQMKEHYVMVKGTDWDCDPDASDGYITFPSEYYPSKRFCPMESLPEGRYIQPYSLTENEDGIIIPMKTMSQLELLPQGPNEPYGFDAIAQLDSRQSYTFRYVQNGRKDGCTGTPKEITYYRRFSGWINGRDYYSFRGSDRPGELANETKIEHEAFMDKPRENSVWGAPEYKGAPGFDHMGW